jgi:branched-chain amino acid transport system permease protein
MLDLLKKKKWYVFAAAIMLLLLVFPLINPSPYILHILIITLYVTSASMAWSILCSLTGQFSLGHAVFATLGTYAVVIFQIKFGLSPWIGMLLGMLIVGAVSTLVFSACFCLRGPYFTLASIAVAEAVRNLFLNWGYVGKASGMLLPLGESSFWMLRFAGKMPYYYLAIGMLIVISGIVFLIDRSRLGYAFKTIREDEDTAEAVGIRPLRYKMIAMFISAALTSLAGSFYAVYIHFVDPDMMVMSYSVEMVLPAVIGGLEFAAGPLVGAFLIPLSELLRANFGTAIPGIHMVLYALVLIIAIRVQPKGILGWYQKNQLEKMHKQLLAAKVSSDAAAGGKDGDTDA